MADMPQLKNKVIKTEFVNWQELKTYEFNQLKDNSNRDISKLKNSIINQGFSFALCNWADHKFIIDGTGRYLALLELEKEGYEIPDLVVNQIEAENIKEAKKLALMVSSQHGQITQSSLADFTSQEFEIEELKELALEELNLGELDFMIENLEPEVIAQEDNFETGEVDQIKTDIVKGDLFEFRKGGKTLHKLMCGDSTSVDAVAKLMNGEKADMAHNDPPYGMKKEKDGVLNDNLNYNDLLDFNREWIPLQFAHLKDNGSFYCWGIDEPLMDIYSDILKPYIAEQKATFRNLITWDKGHGQGQNSENTRSYAIADEKCLFAMMGVQGFNNNADNYFEKWETIRIYLEQEIKKLNESDIKIATALGYKDGRTVNHWWSKSQWNFPTKENYEALRNYSKTKNIDILKKEYDELKKEYEELKKEYYKTRAYFNNTHDNFNNVWKFDRHLRQGDEGGHATPKPIPLCERVIKSSCSENGLVIDFFLGSGSTMVASHQLKRKCYGMELDPKYCQVICDRMKKLDPELEIVKI
jgi:DNA modification methylase